MLPSHSPDEYQQDTKNSYHGNCDYRIYYDIIQVL